MPKGYLWVTLLDTFVLSGCPVIGDSLPLEPNDDLKEKIKSYSGSHTNKITSYSSIAPATLLEIPEGTKISFEDTVEYFWFFPL